MQRRRLLRAFTEIVARDGLDDAGVGRVCRRAGVSRRTFYDLFSDREACFLAAFDDAVERIAQSVVPAYSCGGRWRERVRGALAALLECFEEEPALVHVCLIESTKGGPALHARRRSVLDVLIAAIDQGRSEAKDGNVPVLLTGESVVGGAISVIQARALDQGMRSLIELLNPLMSMIVNPYLGAAAAKRELQFPSPPPKTSRNCHSREDHLAGRHVQDPFKDLPIRITFRTARVLASVATRPGASNREIMGAAGVVDQGQMSKLLGRLEHNGLIENHGYGQAKGEANAWRLTDRGQAIHRAIEAPAVR